jgi:hypothetical protein
MNGSAIKNLDMFIKLCGREYLKNVILVTTKWDTISSDAGATKSKREEELLKDFWGAMLKQGCGYKRYENNFSSAEDIVKPMLSFRPNWLQIQRELGNGRLLSDTTAGKAVDDDVAKVVAKYQERIKSIKKTMQGVGENLRNELDRQAEEYERDIKRLRKEKKTLERNQDALIRSAVEDALKELKEDEDARVRNAIAEAKRRFGPKTLLKQYAERLDNHLPGDMTTKDIAAFGAVAASLFVAHKMENGE